MNARLAGAVGAVLLVATAAGAAEEPSVGKVSLLKGEATRTAEGAGPQPLALGGEVRVKDTLKVAPGGGLKVALNDGSTIMVAGGSALFIDEGSFGDQVRKFKAKLLLGSVWSKVAKAVGGSDAKFEVETDRAVAGVRGTIFRVDATTLVKGTKPATRVRVDEGLVAVSAKVKAKAGAPPPPKPGERVQVKGPQQVDLKTWEEKFQELQAGQQVTVGEDIWEVAQARRRPDTFDRFIDKNQ
jgi:hypothetical protein